MPAPKVTPPHQDLPNLRFLGEHRPALEVLLAAAPLIESLGGELPAARAAESSEPGEVDDYVLVDRDLATEGEKAFGSGKPPAVGVSYAGFSPGWRSHYLRWVATPFPVPAPAFADLWVATLECFFLELAAAGSREPTSEAGAQLSRRYAHAQRLATSQLWQARAQISLERALLLVRALTRTTDTWVEWSLRPSLPAALVDVALSLQALFGLPLQAEQLVQLTGLWRLAQRPPSLALARMRLEDLRQSLGADPLQWALAQGGEAERLPRPWPTAHRSLRFALPQPNVRAALEPLLAEGFAQTVASEPPEGMAEVTAAGGQPVEAGHATFTQPLFGTVVLEFGHSRSEYYTFAVEIAQRQPGYTALLDESRRVVHRVVFRSTQLRQFWRLWDYVANWNNVRVYRNGDEVEHWRIWPGSTYI